MNYPQQAPSGNFMEEETYLLTPVRTVPLTQKEVDIVLENDEEYFQELIGYIRNRNLSTPVSIDFETRNISLIQQIPIGIGLYFPELGRKAIYLDLSYEQGIQRLEQLFDSLIETQLPLMGHNFTFDWGVFVSCFGLEKAAPLNWVADTYSIYRWLASEGWKSFRWGLKDAQVRMLGWTTKGDELLNKWLVDNGYKNQQHKPVKSEMWRAPPDILGYYCALDTYSTYLLYEEVLREPFERFPILVEYAKWFKELQWQLIRQQFTGIKINYKKLALYEKELRKQIDEAYWSFLKIPEVDECVNAKKNKILAELDAKEPPQFLTYSGKEPIKYKKDGSISQGWLNWERKKKEKTSTHSQNWLRWLAKRTEVETKEYFNINSGADLTILFYDKLKYPVQVWTKPSKRFPEGRPSVDKKALKGFGETGKALMSYMKLLKEHQYVSKCITSLREDDTNMDSEEYFLHVSFKTPGTLTGRLGGAGGFNLQQQPKTKGYLSCFIPRKGKQWVDIDFTALEPTVLTELSRDESMWKIYGPGAKANDLYLFVGSQLPIIGPAIRAAGYDPEHPTKEAITKVKKELKKERNIAKTVCLASQYGAGAAKIRATLALDNIHISQEEAVLIHQSYWSLYSGIKRYEQFLEQRWHQFEGFVLNGIGRPMPIAEFLLKDRVNRVCQSTGHDILVLYVSLMTKVLEEEGIKWDPIIIDFHDEVLIEVDKADAERVAALLGGKVMKLLNDKLGGEIPLKGNPEVISSLAEAKVEE